MSDSFLFEYENKFQILVFGINSGDARNLAKAFMRNWKPKLVSKNPTNVNKWVLCATTEKQHELNREKNREQEIDYYKDHPEVLENIISKWAEIGLTYHIEMKDIEE